MIELFGKHDPPKPKTTIAPEFRTALLVVGAGAALFGVIFWKEILLVALVGWYQRPHPIRTLLLRSDTAFYGTYQHPGPTTDDSSYGHERVLAIRPILGDTSAFLLTWSLKTWATDYPHPGRPDYTFTRDREVYRYDPATKSMTVAPKELWDDSSSEILECGGWAPSDSPWRISIQHNRLRLDSGPIAFAGTQLVGVAEAPSRPLLAVVSAADNKPGFAWPGLGGSTAGAGQYYHQVFSLEDRQPIGPQKRLPSRTSQLGESVPKICWSPDESQVIYALPFRGVSIVAVEQASRTGRR